jgi:hypothetical protein
MAVDHYNVYLDDVLIVSIPHPLTTDSIHGLPPGSLHLVQVSAVDTSGNESARSGLASFIVFAPGPVDTAGPELGRPHVFAEPRSYQTPQFHYPYRFTANGFALDETDTPEELESVAWYLLRTPPGWQPHNPSLGTPDPVFTLRPGRIIDSALAQGDERIGALVSEDRDALEEAVARIAVQIGKAAQP